LKGAFSRFLTADPDRLHAAAHSHHPWPDIAYEAHVRAWEDAARLMDDKWDHTFGEVFPAARQRVATVLGLPDPDTLVFAPNTHEFVMRIASNLSQPFLVLTTDSEFHSFARQLTRWEEAAMAKATRVEAAPFDTFPDRLLDAYDDHDLVYLSHVHFNSGYVTPDLPELVTQFPQEATVVIDGYHGFLAIPTDLGAVADRAFYTAGGYKYAMAGEGASFLHVPDAAATRPVDTGWWAGFGSLTDSPKKVAYGPGGQRFAGATFDPSGVYRLEAVLGWLGEEGIEVEDIHRHVGGLQRRLLARLPGSLSERLVPPAGERGHFLTFEMPEAREVYRRLHDRRIITDYRSDRWRVGLGIYHDEGDVDRLAAEIRAVI
jgi:kynureninase